MDYNCYEIHHFLFFTVNKFCTESLPYIDTTVWNWLKNEMKYSISMLGIDKNIKRTHYRRPNG